MAASAFLTACLAMAGLLCQSPAVASPFLTSATTKNETMALETFDVAEDVTRQPDHVTAVYNKNLTNDVSIVIDSSQLNDQGMSENWTNATDEYEDAGMNLTDSQILFYFLLWTVIAPILFGFCAVFGTIGNILVVYVVVSRPQMRTVTNILLVSLAFADIAFLVVCVPTTALRYVTYQWPFGNAACRAVNYLHYVTTYVTIYTLVAITCVRFASVVYPDRTRALRTRRNAVLLSFAIWTVVCLANLPTLPTYVVKVISNYSYCGIEPEAMRPLLVGFFAAGYVIPLAKIALLNIAIVLFLATRKRAAASASASTTTTTTMSVPAAAQTLQVPQSAALAYRRQSPDISTAPLSIGISAATTGGGGSTVDCRARRRHNRTVRVVLPLVLVFGLAWLPLHVQNLVLLYFQHVPGGDWYEVLRVVWNCLAYCNSCANPFIYHRGSREFRRCFREVRASWTHFLCCDWYLDRAKDKRQMSAMDRDATRTLTPAV